MIRQVGRQLSYLGRASHPHQSGRDRCRRGWKPIYAGVTEIITQFQPDYFAIEQVFMAKTADSALKLGQALRGGDRRSDQIRRCRCLIYAAPSVKQTVVRDWQPERARSSIWCAP